MNIIGYIVMIVVGVFITLMLIGGVIIFINIAKYLSNEYRQKKQNNIYKSLFHKTKLPL